jgi:hypothetical protein
MTEELCGIHVQVKPMLAVLRRQQTGCMATVRIGGTLVALRSAAVCES